MSQQEDLQEHKAFESKGEKSIRNNSDRNYVIWNYIRGLFFVYKLRHCLEFVIGRLHIIWEHVCVFYDLIFLEYGFICSCYYSFKGIHAYMKSNKLEFSTGDLGRNHKPYSIICNGFLKTSRCYSFNGEDRVIAISS